MKDKICFIILQYGDEVNGGAEVHCRMVAERLTPFYDVEILTSKFIDTNTCIPFYKEETGQLNGIVIRRFDTIKFDKKAYLSANSKIRLARKIRRNLYRIGILKFLNNFIKNWNLCIENEIKLLKSGRTYTPGLIEFLEKNHQNYKRIIVFTYGHSNSILGALVAPEKTIFIPTAHYDSVLFYSIQTKLFSKVRHIAFNTMAEKTLAEKIFGKNMSANSVVGVGVDIAKTADTDVLLQKFNLPKNYILYFGRVAKGKVNSLIPWFIKFKQKYPSDLKLVITGRIFMKKTENPDIIYTDFVTEAEKTALIINSKIVVNPSSKESLSLLLLESMYLGKTALVNGKSEVMKQHCIRSGYAAQFYKSKNDFFKKLNSLLKNQQLLDSNLNAKKYVESNYDWKVIVEKFRNLID